MAVKTYHDTTLAIDFSFTVLKDYEVVGGQDRECPECKGWVRVSDKNYLGHPHVIEAIIHTRPCENYRNYLRSTGAGDYAISIRN